MESSSASIENQAYLESNDLNKLMETLMHEIIAKKLNAKVYFTRPYTSQDKGTVENRNGIIRMFFPKKTDFNAISKTEIKRVENEINNIPLRKFN